MVISVPSAATGRTRSDREVGLLLRAKHRVRRSIKDWLARALAKALKEGGKTLTHKHLEKSALSVSQCENLLADIVEGEMLLEETSEARVRLRRRMGLEPEFTKVSENGNGPSEGGEEKSAAIRRRRRPGERKPARDPVGIAAKIKQ